MPRPVCAAVPAARIVGLAPFALLSLWSSLETALMAADAAPGPALVVPLAVPLNAIRLDGAGQDPVWARAVGLSAPRVHGQPVAPERSATVRLVQAGGWLLFRLEALEPEGCQAREVSHGAPLWADDHLVLLLEAEAGPAQAQAREAGGGGADPRARRLRLEANPLGAFWIALDGQRSDPRPLLEGRLRGVARLETGRWVLEWAVDLGLFGVSGEHPPVLRCECIRERQQRGATPFEEQRFEVVRLEPHAVPDSGACPVVLEVGPGQAFGGLAQAGAAYQASRPESEQDWARVPPHLLRPEDGRQPVGTDFQATVVRMAVTSGEFCLQARCLEAHPRTVVDAGAALWKEDNLEVFLGPEGFNYLQIATNPRQKVEASAGRTGGRGIRSVPVPAELAVEVRREERVWVVQVRIPIGAILETLGLVPAELHPRLHPWRIQVTRNRPARDVLAQPQQVSLLAVTLSGTSHCPGRFARLNLVERAAQPIPDPEWVLPELPAPVLSAEEARALGASTLFSRWVEARAGSIHEEEQARIQALGDLHGWQEYAARIKAHLARAVYSGREGKAFARKELEALKVYTHPGEGFRVEGWIFQSQAGLPVPVTLYLPAAAGGKERRPALVMVPAHHTPRNSPDLKILGATFARAGGIALAIDEIGSGERSVAARWEHKNYQRNLVGAQLALAGETLAGWTSFDCSRAVDFLCARKDLDPRRIGILGGVAGGGEVCALAAALDERFDVAIPFNFSTLGRMEHWYDPVRCYPGAFAGRFSCAWVIDALIAPRRLVQAQEFAWGKGEEESFTRFRRIWGLYGKQEALAFLHGDRDSHALHFNYMHRLPLYGILNRWWGMALPSRQEEEYVPKIPDGRLECLATEQGQAHLEELRQRRRMWEPHELARKYALSARRRLGDRRGVRALLQDLDPLLGGCAPQPQPGGGARLRALGRWGGFRVEGLWLQAEAGHGAVPALGVAVWLLLPEAPAGRAGHPLVLGLAQQGKAVLLAERSALVRRLLEAGCAVALMDPRGLGESASDPSRNADGRSAATAYALTQLGENLPVQCVRDLRTTLACLAGRGDLDPGRIALWGEGLNEPNGRSDQEPFFGETHLKQASPTPQRRVEPLGATVALLAALFPVRTQGGEVRIRAVLARGGLVSYDAVLARRQHYLPYDAVIPGLLRIADLGDVAGALRKAGCLVLAEDLRDGLNRVLEREEVAGAWGAGAAAEYRPHPSAEAVEALLERLK